MKKKSWEQRYSFRLTEQDEKIRSFIEDSPGSRSDKIRQLLDYGVLYLEKSQTSLQSEELSNEIRNELRSFKEELLKDLRNGTVVAVPATTEVKVEIEEETESSTPEETLNAMDNFLAGFDIDID